MILKIQNIDLDKITDKGHGYENHDIKKEWKYYSNLIAEMKLTKICYPVILLKKNKLYFISDGWHRIEIARKLKWKTIPAVVFTSKKKILENWKKLKQLGYVVE